MGLVNRVVPEGEEVKTALAIAREIAINDREKVRITKQAINRAYSIMGFEQSLAVGLDADVQIEALQTPEGKMFREIRQREGLKAALAWRDARFEKKE
jgi:enoyl-CoA hydratase